LPALVDGFESRLRALGYKVVRNKPYAGGFITEHYCLGSDPGDDLGEMVRQCHEAGRQRQRLLVHIERPVDLDLQLAEVIAGVAAETVELPSHRIAAE
jgi:hypothetical protein